MVLTSCANVNGVISQCKLGKWGAFEQIGEQYSWKCQAVGQRQRGGGGGGAVYKRKQVLVDRGLSGSKEGVGVYVQCGMGVQMLAGRGTYWG